MFRGVDSSARRRARSAPPTWQPMQPANGRQGTLMNLDLKVVRHAPAQLATRYAAPLVLIRPDQIVAWRGEPSVRAAQVLSRVSCTR